MASCNLSLVQTLGCALRLSLLVFSSPVAQEDKGNAHLPVPSISALPQAIHMLNMGPLEAAGTRQWAEDP